MRVLLDTNVVARWLGDRRVPSKVERLLNRRDIEMFVSIVTGWEFILKPGFVDSPMETVLSRLEATLLPVTLPHLSQLVRLPRHHDPFGRMLIAQALSEGLTVISSDARFSEYRGLKVLWD